jgi:LPS export ABC transporter protein LptC
MAVVFMTSGDDAEESGFDDRPVATGGQTSVIYNFHHVESQLDKTSWELSASRAELKGDRARLEKIRMTLFTKAGRSVTIEGSEGDIDIRTKNARVAGGIAAVYNGEYRFTTDEMNWDAERKVVTTSGPVRMVGPEGEIRGGRLEGFPETEEFSLRGGVTVELRNMESELSKATAGGAR